MATDAQALTSENAIALVYWLFLAHQEGLRLCPSESTGQCCYSILSPDDIGDQLVIAFQASPTRKIAVFAKIGEEPLACIQRVE